MRTSLVQLTAAIAAMVICRCALAGGPAPDAFTYQGQLRFHGDPVAGPVDMVFRLYDAESGGTQIGSVLEALGYDGFDDEGRFTMDLAFGSGVFDGGARWLEIEIDGLVLSPRQPIMPTPYAIRALNVATVPDGALVGDYTNALNFTNAGNQLAGSFSGSGAGLSNLNASSITTGTLGGTLLEGNYSNVLNFSNAANTFSGTYSGSGANLTNLNASNLATGTVPGARLSGTYSNSLTFNSAGNFFMGTFSGSGSGLTALNASNIWSGNLASARMPTGGTWSLSTSLNVAGNTLFVDPTTSRLGIGTNLPASRLHVHTASTWADGPQLRLHNAVDQASSLSFSTAFRTWRIGQNRPGGASPADAFFVHDESADATRMIIRPDGRFGIGTTNPLSRLHVLSDDQFVTPMRVQVDDFTRLLVHQNGGMTVGGGANPPENGLRVDGNVGLGTSFPSLRLSLVDSGTGLDRPATNTLGLYTNAIERVRIDNSGNVGIGTANPEARLHLFRAGAEVGMKMRAGGSWVSEIQQTNSSYFNFINGGQVRMTIRAGGQVGIGTEEPGAFRLAVNGAAANSTGSWSVFSDARLKHNIEPLACGTLDQLLALRGCTFEYEDHATENRLAMPGRHVGFIAQEVQSVFPDWVDADPDGYLYITERGTTALIVEALRELRAEKDSQVAALARENDDLRTRLASLENLVAELLAAHPKGDDR